MAIAGIGHNSKSNRANFQRDREMWLIQVLGDRGASPMAKVVATAISIHLNSETRQAWPSHSRLAEMCAANKRTVERATKELEARQHLRVSRKANCANRYEMARVPVKLGVGTGEIAKVTGEIGGRTSEEPLREPKKDYLRHRSQIDDLSEDPPSEGRKGLGEEVRWKEVFEYAERHYPADSPKNVVGKIMRAGVCTPADLLAEMEMAQPDIPFREAVQYQLMQIECQNY